MDDYIRDELAGVNYTSRTRVGAKEEGMMISILPALDLMNYG